MIQIHIERLPGTLAAKLYVYERSNDGTITSYSGDSARTTRPEEGEFPAIEAFATLQEGHMRELVHAFIEYARKEGMKGGEESHAVGKLEATERHLEDMRKLVFEPRKKFVITTDASLSGMEL